LNRRLAENRIDVGADRRRPLSSGLLVAPAGLMRANVRCGTFGEGKAARHGKPVVEALGTPLVDRVNAGEAHLPADASRLPGLGQANVARRPEPHKPMLARYLVPVNPALYAVPADLEE